MSRPSASAVERAGVPLAYALQTLYGTDGASIEEAALRALTPTGPALPELIARITHLREQAAAA